MYRQVDGTYVTLNDFIFLVDGWGHPTLRYISSGFLRCLCFSLSEPPSGTASSSSPDSTSTQPPHLPARVNRVFRGRALGAISSTPGASYALETYDTILEDRAGHRSYDSFPVPVNRGWEGNGGGDETRTWTEREAVHLAGGIVPQGGVDERRAEEYADDGRVRTS